MPLDRKMEGYFFDNSAVMSESIANLNNLPDPETMDAETIVNLEASLESFTEMMTKLRI
jgi:hypothetical protein